MALAAGGAADEARAALATSATASARSEFAGGLGVAADGDHSPVQVR